LFTTPYRPEYAFDFEFRKRIRGRAKRQQPRQNDAQGNFEMNRDQAIDLTSILKGLMPKMTDDQCRTVAQELLPLSHEPTQKAVSDYAEKASDFVLSDFLKCLPGRDVGVTAIERTQSYRLEQERNAERVANERCGIDATFNNLAADCSQEEMAALCEAAAAKYAGTEFGRRMLSRGPAGSKFLRQLVVEYAGKGKAVHAGQTSP
jgi:hypothetical protein